MNVDREYLERLRAKVDTEISRQSSTIIDHARTLAALPEVGFQEWRTHTYMRSVLSDMGLEITTKDGNTAISALIRSQKRPAGPTIAVLADMDAVSSLEEGRDETPRHSCGHYAQGAHLLGAALCLTACHVERAVAGNVRLIACPAEEYAQLTWRREQIRTGHLLGISGKTDLWARGWFAGVDAAISVHLADDLPDSQSLVVPASSDGVGACDVVFTWRENVDFGDGKALRLYWMMQRAIERVGEAENITDIHLFPCGSSAEMQGKTSFRLVWLWRYAEPRDAIQAVVRELLGDVRIQVHFEDFDGYEPLRTDANLTSIVERVWTNRLTQRPVSVIDYVRGATDLGTISRHLPVVHPFVGGTVGTTHTADFQVIDEYAAYVMPVRLICHTIIDWLAIMDTEGDAPL